MWRWVTEYRRVVWRGCAAGWSLVIGAREWWSIVGAEVSMCRICCPGRPPDGARPGRSSVLRGLYPQRITHMAKSRGGLPRDGGGGWAGDILKRRFKFDRLNFYCATVLIPRLGTPGSSTLRLPGWLVRPPGRSCSGIFSKMDQVLVSCIASRTWGRTWRWNTTVRIVN